METEELQNDFIDIAKQFLQLVSNDLDPYTSEKGYIKVDGSAVTLFTPDYVQFAKYGRGAGKKPPLDNILKFVKKNSIRFDGQTEKGTAFAIQASIAKNGTINYVKDAPNALDEAINKHLKDFNIKVGQIMKVSVTNDLNAVYSGLESVRTYTI